MKTGSKKRSARKTGVVREESPEYGGHRSRAVTLDRPGAQLGKIIQRIGKGLPFRELEHLQSELDEPMEVLARQLSISRSTLQRRKAERRLSPEESERVVRFSRIVKHATDLFGTMDRARQWLKFPQFGLGGAIPIEFAKTELGAREVEDLLGRIDYGVYS